MLKNVLQINTHYLAGGAAKVAKDLGESLPDNGFNTKYLIGYGSSTKDKVSVLSTLKLDSKVLNRYSYLFNYYKSYFLSNDIDSGASDEILNHSWFKDADIVHCHNLHGNYFKLETLIKMSKEKPVVWTLHDMWVITAHCAHCFNCKTYNNGQHFTPGTNHYQAMLWDNSKYLWNRKKDVYKRSKLNIVVPSLWLKNKLKGSILEGHSVTLINNGIDTEMFNFGDKLKSRKKLELPTDKFIILYVANNARKNPFKGWSYFQEIVKHFVERDDVLFLNVGDVASKIQGNVLNIPYVSDTNKLVEYYRASDMFLFTSLAENFPLVTLEAMATGLPIVSFDVGGVKEQIEHKVNGYIAKYKDKKDLISGVDWVLGLSEEERRKIGKRNREKAVNKYSLNAMTQKYIKLYESLI